MPNNILCIINLVGSFCLIIISIFEIIEIIVTLEKKVSPIRYRIHKRWLVIFKIMLVLNIIIFFYSILCLWLLNG